MELRKLPHILASQREVHFCFYSC